MCRMKTRRGAGGQRAVGDPGQPKMTTIRPNWPTQRLLSFPAWHELQFLPCRCPVTSSSASLYLAAQEEAPAEQTSDHEDGQAHPVQTQEPNQPEAGPSSSAHATTSDVTSPHPSPDKRWVEDLNGSCKQARRLGPAHTTRAAGLRALAHVQAPGLTAKHPSALQRH